MKSNEDHPRRKTYLPMILWAVALCLLLPLPGVFWDDSASEDTLVRLMLLLTLPAIDTLMLIIHFGDYAYWINGGPTFEQCCAATREQRRGYTGAHLRVFAWASAFCAVELLVSWALNLPFWLDVIAFCAILIVAALRTLPIHFSDYDPNRNA